MRPRASFRLLLAGVLVVTLLAVIAIRFTRQPETHVAVETSRTNLVLIDGRLFQNGDTNPFTGIMLDHYPNGALQSRSTVLQGVLDGISEGFYTNGQIQVREHFRAGVSHGMRVKWFPNGGKLSEAGIVNGEIDGMFRRWHENGQLAEQVRFRNGQPDGTSQAFYASGFLKAEALHQSGQIVTQKFWQDGELAAAKLTRANAP